MLTTTPLPLPVQTESSEIVEFEDNSRNWHFVSDHAKAAEWGARTIAPLGVTGQDEKRDLPYTSITSTSYNNTFSNNRLFSAWCEKMITTMTDWDRDTLKQVVTISERYVLALKNSPSHRLFISSLLNIFRFNEGISNQEVEQISRILQRYRLAHISKPEVISFIRELRSAGYSPSSVGSLDVE